MHHSVNKLTLCVYLTVIGHFPSLIQKIKKNCDISQLLMNLFVINVVFRDILSVLYNYIHYWICILEFNTKWISLFSCCVFIFYSSSVIKKNWLKWNAQSIDGMGEEVLDVSRTLRSMYILYCFNSINLLFVYIWQWLVIFHIWTRWQETRGH